jgi:multidrug efflux system outer membrane protein
MKTSAPINDQPECTCVECTKRNPAAGVNHWTTPDDRPRTVTQTAQSAVSPVAKPADRGRLGRIGKFERLTAWPRRTGANLFQSLRNQNEIFCFRWNLWLVAVLAVAITGCVVGPKYQRPPVQANQPLPKAFAELGPAGTNQMAWKIAVPAASQPRGEWWKMFQDGKLNQLEALARTNNQNIAAAAAQFAQARALATEARANFYPAVFAGGTPGGDIGANRTSRDAPQDGNAAGQSFSYDTFTAPLYLGWEPDLWGRIRNQSAAARAHYVAAADDLASAQLDLAAETADDYFTLRALDSEHSILVDTITTYRRSLEVVKNRRLGGVVTDLDVAQAATQLHSAEAELPAIELQRAQLQDALALLCGQPPMAFNLATNSLTSTTFPTVPATLPGDLLEHRPDIAAAERRMAAANANVGVAKSAFFPSIRINGLAGFQSIDAGSLFSWANRFWAVGPTLEFPIFTGGFNTAQLAASRAAYNQTVANYRQTVLSAFSEVQDALYAQSLLALQWQAENEALQSSQQALAIANNRYNAGLDIYLDVATAQSDTLTHENTVATLSGQRLVATINLIKALGSGWDQVNPPR